MNSIPSQILIEFLQKRGLLVEGSVLRMVTEALIIRQPVNGGVEPCSQELIKKLENGVMMVGDDDLKKVGSFLRQEVGNGTER